MLSPASYQLLRFEGRQNRLSDAADAPQGHDEAPRRLAPVRATREEPTLTADEQRLVASVLGPVGLDAASYRSGPFHRRMPAVLRALRATTLQQAVERVASQPALAARALETLLIGHTEPFRDAETFEDLRSRVLPTLAEGRSGLRVWSVGCSGGVELLSAALLLAERGHLAGSTLRGSDCRAAAIASARTGLSLQLLASLPGQFDSLRSLVDADFGAAIATASWVVEDALSADYAKSSWDLVFCRNLAIYLDAQSSQRLWARLVAALAPGGVLVTGRAERPPANLPLARLAKCIFRLERGTACPT